MKSLFTIVFCLVLSSAFSAELLKEEKAGYYLISKIKIEDHSYIHMKSCWNSADSHLWHDPACEFCMKMFKGIKKGDIILENK